MVALLYPFNPLVEIQFFYLLQAGWNHISKINGIPWASAQNPQNHDFHLEALKEFYQYLMKFGSETGVKFNGHYAPTLLLTQQSLARQTLSLRLGCSLYIYTAYVWSSLLYVH